MSILITPSQPEYAEKIVRVIYQGYYANPDTQWGEFSSTTSPERIIRNIELFPEGQFMALDLETDIVIGVTQSMRMAFDPAQPLLKTWIETTAAGWFTTHDPDGEWMYGSETLVHPDVHGRGVGGALMDARFDVLRQLNLRGMIAGSMPIDYHHYEDTMTVQEYVDAVVAGTIFDTNLTKQLHKGFRVQNLIPNYIDEPRTQSYGVAVLWANPNYQPGKKVAHVQPKSFEIELKPQRMPAVEV